LHRYLADFDSRFNNRELSDAKRAITAGRGVEDKRLTHRQRHANI
jgi:hypothetical protein